MGRLWIEKAEWDNLARSENVDECRALEKNATLADAGASQLPKLQVCGTVKTQEAGLPSISCVAYWPPPLVRV